MRPSSAHRGSRPVGEGLLRFTLAVRTPYRLDRTVAVLQRLPSSPVDRWAGGAYLRAFDGEAGPYSEDDLPNARGAYARTKRCGEEAALLLAPDCAVARVAVVYSGRPGAKSTFATQVVEKLSRGEPVKAFVDQFVSTTLADSGAAMCLELLLETDYRGVLHTSDATVLTRVEFAERVAKVFGLTGEIVRVLTADVKLLAPRPLRGGLVVTRAEALLRNRPLPIDEALDRFFAEW